MTAYDEATLHRAQGCLLGQLAGDALGSLVEFRSAADIKKAHPRGVKVMVDGGTWNTIAGQPTDDSELALSLARTLVTTRSFDEEAIASAYVRWYDSHPFDIGTTTSRALSAGAAAARAGASIAEACRSAANVKSEANGALMRISPLGIFGMPFDRDELEAWARADALLTHPSTVCQESSAVFVSAIADAIAGKSRQEVYKRVGERVRDIYPMLADVVSAVSVSPPAAADGPNQGWARIAVQNAFYRMLHAPSLEDGIVETVMMGGDTDTNAAIAGALLGAVHGVDAVPRQWRDSILACRLESGRPGVHRPRPKEYWPTDALELAAALLDVGASCATQMMRRK